MVLACLCLFLCANAQDTVKAKDPGLAWFMSLVVPGAGQYYNGQYVKGGIMTGIWAGSITGFSIALYRSNHRDHGEEYMCHHEDTGLALSSMFVFVLVELWAMIDAPIVSNKINKKNRLTVTPDLSMLTMTPSGNRMLAPAYGVKMRMTF